MAVSLAVILLIAMATVWLDRRKPTDDRGPQTNPSVRVEPANVEPAVRYHVTRRPDELRFRVVDANDRTPIGQARIVIDNLNLAPELGEDSDDDVPLSSAARGGGEGLVPMILSLETAMPACSTTRHGTGPHLDRGDQPMRQGVFVLLQP
jgi:hypothetical protein